MINTENILSSLLLLGYENIEPTLYVDVVAQLHSKGVILGKEKPLSKPFEECMILLNGSYSFKEGYDMNTNVAPLCGFNENMYISFRDYINSSTNLKLLQIIRELNVYDKNSKVMIK